MITLDAYLMGRQGTFAEYYSEVIKSNALELLERVNALIAVLDIPKERIFVVSGWRPPPVNTQVGGKPRSSHLNGKAVDLTDPLFSLSEAIYADESLLDKFDLYMEAKPATPTWVHLQTTRTASGKRIFFP